MAEFEKRYDGYVIQVDKIGGGTLGKEYTGDWIARSWTLENGEYVFDAWLPIATGMPHTHEYVASLFHDYMTD